MFDKLATVETQYDELMTRLGTVEVQSDAAEYRKAAKALSDLEPLVQEAIAREGASDRVTLVLSPGLRVSAEPDLLRRAVGNLVRNALRYAGDAGPVTVRAEIGRAHV